VTIDIKALAKELKRPIETLIALHANHDPFYFTPGRLLAANWFHDIWSGLGIEVAHTRRIHYRLVSQATPVRMPNGEPYLNTDLCAKKLGEAVRDAIYLDLIPGEAIVDHKNDAPRLFLPDAIPAQFMVFDAEFEEDSAWDLPETLPDLPSLRLISPKGAQRYHVEIWAEKSTINDILLPLATQFGVNVVTGSGDLSATHCRDAVNRFEKSGKPVRLLYVSDFDPGGDSMPVGVSSKIMFDLAKRDLSLNVQVRSVALTHKQCIDLALPRTPITKKGDSRAVRFEQRFGEGATELDALEAIYPGRLAEILRAEILRYHDPDLGQKITIASYEARKLLAPINEEIAAPFDAEVAVLETEYQEIRGRLADLGERAKDVWARACASLEENTPEEEEIVEWPEPAFGDEDPDPLFDSNRPYVEQIDRFKHHQDKPTGRKPRKPKAMN
jgi:hypothetical protein